MDKAAVSNNVISCSGFTDNFNTLVDVLSTAKFGADFDPDAKALSTLPDGTYCTISTDAESDTAVAFMMQCN